MTQRLFILPKNVVFKARVNMAAIEYDLTEITYDTVTVGSFSNVKQGMTLLVGSSDGESDLGRQRIRKDAISGTLYIGRSSQGVRDGELNVSDNAYLTVLGDRRVWAKIPDIDSNGDIVKDEIVYTDQTSQIPPKAIIEGGWRAAEIDSVTSLATFQFVGSGSYAVADGATITTYSWDVGSGTITAGSGTSQITATFPAGYHFIKLTVTDSNAKTHFMEVLALAHDPANSLCVDFQCTEHRITQAGQFCSFRILEDIDAATYPDGTAVLLWDGQPAGSSDYSNVKFWGWHQSDQNSVFAEPEATLKDVTLQCLDVAGRLDTLPAFTQSVQLHSSPSSWLQMSNLTMDKYLDYLYRWHSNALEIAAFYLSGTGDAFQMGIISSGGQSLFKQVAQRAASLVPDYLHTCDRNGHLRIVPNPILQDTADRTATSQAALTAANWISANWERRRPPLYHWLWSEALQTWTTGDPVPLFCRAPGVAPGQGESEQSQGEQLAQSQDDLNACEGHRYAYINAFHGQIVVTMATDLGIEPADGTWVTLTIANTYTRRSQGFSAVRCLPREINISYEYGREAVTKRVELILEAETNGTPAVTYEQPEPPWDPPYIPPPNDPPDPTPPGAGTGFGTAWIMTKDVLAHTPNFGATSPTYSAVATPGVGEDFYDFILDPFNFSDNGFKVSSNGVEKSENLSGAKTFSPVLSVSDMETLTGASGTLSAYVQIKGTIKQQGFFAIAARDVVNDSSARVYMFVTTDGGNTWNAYEVYERLTAPAGTHTIYSGGFDIAQNVLSGTGQPVMGITFGKDTLTKYYKSTDGGQTWSAVATGFTVTNGYGVDLHFPYNDNASLNYILLPTRTSGTSDLIYYISSNGGTSWTGITATGISGDINHRSFNRTPFQSWTQDRQQLYTFGGSPAGYNGFYRSNNFGTTWSKISTLPANVQAAGGFPYNSGQFYVVTTNGIYVTTNGGVTWVNKTGNWSWGFSFVGFGDLDCGGVIVPNPLE